MDVPTMQAKQSRLLVIDTVITSSAGGNSSTEGENTTVSRAVICREFLNAVFTLCHRMVMTDDLWDEWKAHRSSFSEQWYFRMKRKNKVKRVEVEPDKKLLEKLKRFISTETAYEAVEKDFLLIQAAQASDRIIFSLDEATRKPLSEAATHIGEIRLIYWLNPEHTDDDCIAWLENSCPPEKRRGLGYKSDE